MQVSVIIPAFNEEDKLGNTVKEITRYLKDMKDGCEMIIVDDGSSDGTSSVADDIAKDAALRTTVLKNDRNMGKGFSVKKGILASSGKFVAFSDADLSTPIEELDKLFAYVENGHDIAIGSRGKKESDVRIRQPLHRQMMGKVFNLFVKLLLLRDFNDTQCGLKLFRGDCAREVARRLKIDGFSFDVEMLYIAKKNGYKIKEVGIVWNNSPESKVKIINSSLKMFLDLLKIKKLHG